MPLPTNAVPSRVGARVQRYAITTQTASFDLPIQNKGAFAIALQIIGTIGTSTNNFQGSVDNTTFTNLALLQSPVVGHTELVNLTVALSPYSVHRADLGYPYFNLHHVAGGGSSLSFYISIVEL